MEEGPRARTRMGTAATELVHGYVLAGRADWHTGCMMIGVESI